MATEGRRTMKILLSLSAIAALSMADKVGSSNGIGRRLSGPTACGRDSNFNAYALVEHEMMVDPNTIDDEELQLLATGFENHYNVANAPQGGKNDACDEAHLRYAYDTTIEPKDVFYLDLPEGGFPARRNFLYRVKISGVNVSDDTTMFQFDYDDEMNDMSERDLWAVPEQILDSARTKVCTCSANITDIRAPTEEEFTSYLNRFIKKQTTKGRLSNIGRAIHVTELVVVDCEPELMEYDTSVAVELGGEKIKEELDLEVLESDFRDSYNDLAGHFCDPCFRQVVSVKIEEEIIDDEEEDPQDRMLADADATNQKTATRQKRDPTRQKRDATKQQADATKKKSGRRKRLINTVKTRCRKKTKCQRRRKLFDDAVARRLAPLVPVSPPGERYRGRRIESENVCFCPTQPDGDRPPTTEEFQRMYNHITKRTSSVSVKEVTE